MVRPLAVLLIVLPMTAACSGDEPDAAPTLPSSGDGVVIASYGSIDYMAATPFVDSDHVLESMACEGSAFSMTTSGGMFTGSMDCSALPPPDVIDQFAGNPITIRITSSRLKIEALGAGTLDMPVVGGRLEEG